MFAVAIADLFSSLKSATACASCTCCLPDQMLISCANCQSGTWSVRVAGTEADTRNVLSHCWKNSWNLESFKHSMIHIQLHAILIQGIDN